MSYQLKRNKAEWIEGNSHMKRIKGTYRTEGRSRMRTIKATGFAAVSGGVIALLGSLPAHAAVLSVGTANATYGGYTCADVQSGSLTNLTSVQAWDCHAGPNQQYEFNGLTVYALGGQRCLDVRGSGTAAGTTVDSYPCNGTGAQQWYYYNGEMINLHSGLCLDAGNMANGTQLVINDCNESASQTWQIK